MTTNKASKLLREGAPLILTHTPNGAAYSIDGHGAVPSRYARAVTRESLEQGELFLRPNEDGLFPGCSQTWKLEG